MLDNTGRILKINKVFEAASGKCVVYVMSRDQRVNDNHALIAAQQSAIDLGLPLIVCFNLLPMLGLRSYEHFNFMLSGLRQVKDQLEKHNINFVLTIGHANDELTALFNQIKPAAVYFDFNPLRHARSLAKEIAGNSDFACYVVDTHNIIPCWIASDKKEFAAYTFRPKVHKLLQKYLVEPEKLHNHPYEYVGKLNSKTFADANEAISKIDKFGIKVDFESGEKAAKKSLENFINHKLENYAQSRNDINADGQSELSPYLHFGQISSLRVALDVMYEVKKPPLLFEESKMAQASDTPTKFDGMNALLEEMVVRKELSDNFCFYNDDYDKLEGAEQWAINSLHEHQGDKRDYIYTQEQFENAKTHDEAWNAAQLQLRQSGKIHGYMRMYWAKKILEWTPDAETAIKYAIYLNDAYSIDGGDPNGYVGVLWSIAGVHDRPWIDRPVFGKIRYMNEGGLRRKFDLDKYVNTWSN